MKILFLSVLSLFTVSQSSLASPRFSEYVLESYLVPSESIVVQCQDDDCDQFKLQHYATNQLFRPVTLTRDEVYEWSSVHSWAVNHLMKVLDGNESIVNFPDHQFERFRELCLSLGVAPNLHSATENR